MLWTQFEIGTGKYHGLIAFERGTEVPVMVVCTNSTLIAREMHSRMCCMDLLTPNGRDVGNVDVGILPQLSSNGIIGVTAGFSNNIRCMINARGCLLTPTAQLSDGYSSGWERVALSSLTLGSQLLEYNCSSHQFDGQSECFSPTLCGHGCQQMSGVIFPCSKDRYHHL